MNRKVLMNRLGYHEYRSRSGTISYIRRLSGQAYPRFHIYIDDVSQGTAFKLHLDEKQPSYQGHTAHSGQYEGEYVEAEMQRIVQYLEQQSAS